MRFPIYIKDTNAELRQEGEASDVWLKHALFDLSQTLDNKLSFFKH